MGLGRNAQPLRIGGVTNSTIEVLEYTVSSGVVTAVRVPSGWSLADFSSGVAALTFPTHYDVFFPIDGHDDTDNASATSRHTLRTVTVSKSAGTASVRSEDANDGTTENPADGTIQLAFIVGN